MALVEITMTLHHLGLASHSEIRRIHRQQKRARDVRYCTLPIAAFQLFGSRLQSLNSHGRETFSVHELLTVSTASPALEHEAIRHCTISTQRRQLPVASDDRRDTSGKDQQVVAQVEGGGAAFQFGTRLDIDTEPVD